MVAVKFFSNRSVLFVNTVTPSMTALNLGVVVLLPGSVAPWTRSCNRRAGTFCMQASSSSALRPPQSAASASAVKLLELSGVRLAAAPDIAIAPLTMGSSPWA